MIFSKKEYFIYIFIMVLLIFISYFAIDKKVAMYFIGHADIYKHIGKIIGIFGQSQWYIGTAIVGALYYAFMKKNSVYLHRFLFLLYANIFSGLASLVFKIFFARMRPWKLENGGDGYGFLISQNPDFTFLQDIKYQFSMLIHSSTTNTSFPSGHTTTIFAMFTYMSILFPRYIYLWLGLASVEGFSRVLANDHFISDILAGILVGTISTMFVYSKVKEKINTKKQK